MSQSQRTLSRLVGNPDNPRRITDAKLSQLGKSLAKFGDLSGVVYNTTSKRLVGGHQRAKALPQDAVIDIAKTYDKPTPTGTVAEGYVSIKDERFAYREVRWDAATEKAANLAANANAGQWDLPKVALWMEDLKAVSFDMSLTMFDLSEIEMLKYDLPQSAQSPQSVSETVVESPVQSEQVSRKSEYTSADFDNLAHTCPRCGFGFDG